MVQPANRRAVTEATLAPLLKRIPAVGDGTTDDTTAIQTYLNSLTVWADTARVVVHFPACAGYRVTDTITVPRGVDVLMDAPILYAGPAGRPALVHGAAGADVIVNRGRSRYRVRRTTTTDWTNEADVGIRVINGYRSDFDVAEVTGFTIGFQAIGDGYGFAYNKLYLSHLQDNKISLDFTSNNGGWCNQNQTFGGSFTVGSTTHTSLDRIGIRINSLAATKYYSNGNTFKNPSFEIKGDGIAGEGLCMQVLYGLNNWIEDARHESPDLVGGRQLNGSANNGAEFLYNIYAKPPTADDAGTYSGFVVKVGSTASADAARRLVRKVDGMHRRAVPYNGTTNINVPGCAFLFSSTTRTLFPYSSTGGALVTINPGYLEVAGSIAVGFFMSTARVKNFTVAADTDPGYGGRFTIGAYAADGSSISTAGTVRSDVDNPINATSFGGAWRNGTDQTGPRHFGVSAAVDHVFIGIGGGSAVARVRSLAVFVRDGQPVPATWLPWVDMDEPRAITPPTVGTYERGQRIYNDTPSAGGSIGWVCTTAGTPGTWKTFGVITA